MIIGPSLTTICNTLGSYQSWQQRLTLGVTAAPTQMSIDYFNENVDEKTRDYSVKRTGAKILVGSSVGVSTRLVGGKIGEKYAQKVLNLTDPKDLKLEGVKNTFAVIATILTIACIDVPLTNKFLNYILNKFDVKSVFSKNNTGESR